MSGKPFPMRVAEWLDSPTADPSRHHVLAAVREAYPDAVEMATTFVRVRASEAWEAFLYGVMIERAITSEPPPHDLTPSEVALAKMLSAATDWLRPGHDDDSREANAIRRACAQFVDLGLMYAGTGQSTETGRALLDRARKAGVL